MNELNAALTNESVDTIKLGFDTGSFSVTRLVDIDLNGYSTGEVSYNTDEAGTIRLLNTGDATEIDSLQVNAPNTTFELGNGIIVTGETIVSNVAIGTFKTEAEHTGKINIQDPDGGSLNFTNSSINGGIEINPIQTTTDAVIIRGDAPTSKEGGNATIRVLGESPKVKVEGRTNDISIEAPNSEFELSASGDATNISIDETAIGTSKIITSKNYEFELLFSEGQTVADMVNSELFGEKQIRVVGYPEEIKPIKNNQLLKLDSAHMSTLYEISESDTLLKEEEGVVEVDGNFFKVDIDQKAVYFNGEVTAKQVREHLETNDPFNDEFLIMSFYSVLPSETLLYPSESANEEDSEWDYLKMMRVLVGTNDQHGLYVLNRK